MRPFLLLLFLVLSIVPPLPAAPDQRILLIAAPSLNDDAYRTQAALLLPALAGLNERDFVVQIQFGTKSFSVVLIGKDGGEKLRRATPLSPEELFAIVDAMPMRRAEMRGQK
ncbi:MAG: hypothetical protein B9S26_04000 [Opitutia bacterium Tous-C4FEB]|jgi:hypothetical protein|nr:MAG: hypothetical protein B9S35_01295 [Opitutae bacterium Tous-C5TDCM]PAW90607.1 MAG: hypothetical protein B9S26_04000 [Opitutae bacterium Tous-C4FEB]